MKKRCFLPALNSSPMADLGWGITGVLTALPIGCQEKQLNFEKRKRRESVVIHVANSLSLLCMVHLIPLLLYRCRRLPGHGHRVLVYCKIGYKVSMAPQRLLRLLAAGSVTQPASSIVIRSVQYYTICISGGIH